MKKILLILLSITIALTGCKKENSMEESNDIKEIEEEIIEKEEIVEEPEQEEIIEEYKDENTTPIAIYKNKEKVTEYKTNYTLGKDIAKFQIFPSNEDHLSYSGNFGRAFHNEWIKYSPNNNLKIGVNLKYDLGDGRVASHTIKHVPETYAYEGYILLFLYDDYDLEVNNKIYSHIEVGEENENTVISSIKLYPGSAVHDINSKVEITVFTYDGEDDFDEFGEYRGNSKYTITMCDPNKTC